MTKIHNILLITFSLFLVGNLSAQKIANTDTSDDIRIIARLDIEDGKWEAFQKIAKECKQVVEVKDQGTLQYEWFYDKAQMKCVVIEHFVSSEAVLDHSANAREALGRLAGVTTMSLEVFGDPSPALQKAFEGKKVKFYKALF